MTTVKIRKGEDIDEALRRFKRECEKDGIIQEIKKREFYEPPSVRKKKKIGEMKRRIRSRTLKEKRIFY